ncbi:MAG: universal stress protein [bacterium]|nr:universal stress protein [bacterium]
MERFRKILLFVNDPSADQETLDRAVALARNSGADLTLLGVVPKIPGELQQWVTATRLSRIQKATGQARVEEINELAAPLRNAGLPIRTTVVTGTAFIQIVREVMRGGHDLLMVTAGGKGLMRNIRFDPTTLQLMRKSPCPVWAVKPGVSRGPLRILAAVDPLPSDRVRDSLNRRILELATSLARMEKGELHVIHTWQVRFEKRLRGRRKLSEGAAVQVNDAARQLHRERLNLLLAGWGAEIPPHRVHLLKGEAGTVIPEFTAKRAMDIIVLGTVGRTGVAGFFIGNTAEMVLQQVDCSVLAVKPDGFESPVRLA